MRNPYPESNTAAEKVAEANAFSQGYYTAASFGWWTTHPYRAWTLRHIMPHLDLYDHFHVLEPACGCGVNLYNLHERFPNAECLGVELAPEGVAVAQAVAPGEYRCGDAENLPVPDQSQDLVLCIASVHHFKDPRRFLFECVRTLKPSGLLYVFEPDSGNYKMTPEQEKEANALKNTIRDANKHGPRPPCSPSVKAKTEVPFDREGLLLQLDALGMNTIETGHSEIMTEWARGCLHKWELTAEFDAAIAGGNKFWGVFDRRG